MQRIDSLDYLRGIMALSVMIYHYSSWYGLELSPANPLEKLGIYAVSTFYILSGVSLGLIYKDRITNFASVKAFYIKRLFRIVPLLWMTITAYITLKFLYSKISDAPFDYTIERILLNYSLAFSVYNISEYIPIGSWSIGNELTFYAILPAILLLNRKSNLFLPASIIGSLLIGYHFAFNIMKPELSIGSQWITYINPFNQLYLFMAGIALGAYLPKNIQALTGAKRASLSAALVFGILLFAFLPLDSQGEIVTGISRVILSASCILIVACTYTLNPKSPPRMGKILSTLGEGCYSIYLLHPLVSMTLVLVLSKVGIGTGPAYILSIFATIAVSRLTYHYVEKPMMGIGKKISNRATQGSAKENHTSATTFKT
ncbi:acyltransferase family protein [Pseudomonas sp. PDM13]|uniref:acyltransferase family protein n=1 Tax=Pseudomonas sp. PDM13 TaxID=2769255 RepID=UPI0021DF8F96|nr:acyltransferase [Pseudomonas sp. PDM13]MCU9945952.1 acyltransferase [Pseudomonas sp. PDM13]